MLRAGEAGFFMVQAGWAPIVHAASAHGREFPWDTPKLPPLP